jgi:hypothetical protein
MSLMGLDHTPFYLKIKVMTLLRYNCCLIKPVDLSVKGQGWRPRAISSYVGPHTEIQTGKPPYQSPFRRLCRHQRGIACAACFVRELKRPPYEDACTRSGIFYDWR